MSELYREAGVDLEKGYEAVRRIKKQIERTTRPEVIGGIGSFAGLFDLTAHHYEEPVLVSGTDGVGTKLMLAFEQNRHTTIGIDLVAMCVNDIVAQGAKPLFFLDYIACGKNDPKKIEEIVSGIAEGCVQAGAALIGGETAEMPDMYKDDEYDLAGFVVGIAEKSKLITGEAIEQGDVIIGLSSSGIHSNGYSLVRKIVASLDLEKVYEPFTKPLGEVLLEPTKIYAPSIATVLEQEEIKGITHITGGGFYENFTRMMKEGLGVLLNPSKWYVPEIFSFLQKQGEILEKEMYQVFNMGIGMALVVEENRADEIVRLLKEQGEKASVIGEVIDQEGVHFV